MNQKLNTIDGVTLMAKPFVPLPFIVDTLLSQGLHILAGSPKVGKSWLALWLSVQVAKGESVWGRPAKQGTTLYLCLEDSQLRIQNRLLDITEDAPPTVHFSTEAALLGRGLEQQLKAFLAEHPDTVLVIIDTLQMIRGTNSMPMTTETSLSSSGWPTLTASPSCSSIIYARNPPRMCSAASPAPPPSAARWIPASRWWRIGGAAAEPPSTV
ncbi:AAA family ATPase [Vermiculatibacterium agrestimuris]|uniref:AAA family ATPase n=1 Tax=Vermiculatibacterium agrestimuris TaxID=2941519 RepID=UPI00203C40EA|nr:AAA family ATPase [Vermiculatibacterium agrestimuris]